MESQEYVYLLTSLSFPTETQYLSPHSNIGEGYSEEVSEINLVSIGVNLRKVTILDSQRSKKGLQLNLEIFAFTINNGEMNDAFAQLVADAVMASLAVVGEYVLDEGPTVIRIPKSKVMSGEIINIHDALGNEDIGMMQRLQYFNAIGVPSEVLGRVLQIVPAVVKNQSLLDAASFYRESITNVCVSDGDLFEMVSDGNDIPTTSSERATVETAYQNAFKSIEAIIGEPPSDQRKFRLKLVKQGFNPDEIVGYMKLGEQPLMKKILDMQNTRDKKAAHGRRGQPREISYCELKDKQALARYIIIQSMASLSQQ